MALQKGGTKPKTEPAKKQTTGKALAPVSRGAVAVPDDLAAQILKDAQSGVQTFKQDDLSIPFLRVLQQLSPQVDRRHEAYVEGAEEGMFLNTATNELWDGEKGIHVVPIFYTPSFIEWKLREKGGGMVRDWGADASVLARTERDEKNRNIITDNPDHQIVQSGLYFVFVVDPSTGAYQELAFPLQGMQLKKSRRWNTLIKTWLTEVPGADRPINPAPFFGVYHITSVYESNEQGKWFGVTITRAKNEDGSDMKTIELPNGYDIYRAASQYREMVAAGRVKVKHEAEEAEYEVEDEAGDKAF